ncbi:MAG TPA: Hsp33 family molecular chaperone HslO, partial [Blastocatellia bacterium]|nr:Hsp33 family molecular chaperone HslO [Blastocatellia bacterium]
MQLNEDKLVHAVAADNQVRCVAAVTTALVGEAARRHETAPAASVALGRTLTGALLLGGGVKDLERVTVHFQCDGPIGNIFAQANPRGHVRGYVSNPKADTTEANSFGKVDVRGVVGNGRMYVIRDAGFEIGLLKEPYRGTVPITSGEIAQDFAYYLTVSEQVNSGVSLGVVIKIEGPDGNASYRNFNTPEFDIDHLRVTAAGGYIVQMMPGADEKLISRLEKSLSSAPPSTEMVMNGLTPAEMLRAALGDVDLTILEEMEPRFQCQCSHERALLIISALG